MIKRLLTLFVVVPIGIILIVLAVTNRQPVRIDVPPYVGDAPFLSFSIPLFALVFLAVLAGMFLGSFATWLKQGRHRKQAREQKVEATKWHFEADKEKERADKLVEKISSDEARPTSGALPSPS